MMASSGLVGVGDEALIHVAEFENEKIRFLNIGRLALSTVFVSGKFLEAERICDIILALDPEDIETQDYKRDAKYFQTHPEHFDPSKVFSTDENLTSRNQAKPRKMLRSVSERRPLRRKALPSATTTTNSGLSNGFQSGSKIPTSSLSDNEVFDGNNNSGLNGDGDVTPVPKLQRSQSESSKRSTSVLQKIKRFEAQARGDAPPTSRVPSFRKQGSDDDGSKPADVKPSLTFGLDPPSIRVQRRGADAIMNGNEVTSSSSKILQTSPTTPVKPATENTSSLFLKPPTPPVGKIRATSPGRSETVSGSRIPVTLSNLSYRASGSVKWNAGLNVEEELRGKLDREFFGSNLLSGAVFASSDGNILGSSHKGCRATPAEIQSLMNRMSKRELITSSKVKLGGIEYSCLSATAHIVRARVRNLGINCSIFKSGIVIALYEEPVLPKPVGKLVQHIGELLTNYEY